MKLYRYDSVNQTETVKLRLSEFKVVRETACGYWVTDTIYTYYPDWSFEEYRKHNIYMRWVSKTARKRLCYLTKELAMESFKIRKRRHFDILNNQLEIARLACQLGLDKMIISKPSTLCFQEI